MSTPTFTQQQLEQDKKRFLLWLWVGIITAAIIVGWVFTFRAAAKKVLSEQPPAETQTAKDLRLELEKSLTEFKKNWQEAIERE